MLHAATSAPIAPSTDIHGHDAPPTPAAGGGAGSILTGAPMSARRAGLRGSKPAAATRNRPACRNRTVARNVFGGTSTRIETRRLKNAQARIPRLARPDLLGPGVPDLMSALHRRGLGGSPGRHE